MQPEFQSETAAHAMAFMMNFRRWLSTDRGYKQEWGLLYEMRQRATQLAEDEAVSLFKLISPSITLDTLSLHLAQFHIMISKLIDFECQGEYEPHQQQAFVLLQKSAEDVKNALLVGITKYSEMTGAFS